MPAIRMMRASKFSTTAVKVTLGPKGAANVVLDKSFGAPPHYQGRPSTVAKEIELDDKFENMGAQMGARSRLPRSADAAGDGTTPPQTVLAAAIVREGAKAVCRRHEPRWI